MTAHDRLRDALRDLARHGQRPRCGDAETSHHWTSELAAERRQAAAWCAGCPILTECAAAADETRERWGVWGGLDRETRTPSKKDDAA